MQQAAAAESFQEIVVGVLVSLRRRGLEPIRRVARDGQAEQLIQAGSNTALRQVKLDVLVYRERNEFRAIFAGAPASIRGIEGAST